jgi:sulfur carrier protein
MIVKINGQDVEIAEGVAIEEFLAQRKINPKSVVVEYNRRILKPQEWREAILKEDDSLEIISFVGGG